MFSSKCHKPQCGGDVPVTRAAPNEISFTRGLRCRRVAVRVPAGGR